MRHRLCRINYAKGHTWDHACKIEKSSHVFSIPILRRFEKTYLSRLGEISSSKIEIAMILNDPFWTPAQEFFPGNKKIKKFFSKIHLKGGCECRMHGWNQTVFICSRIILSITNSLKWYNNVNKMMWLIQSQERGHWFVFSLM